MKASNHLLWYFLFYKEPSRAQERINKALTIKRAINNQNQWDERKTWIQA